MALTKRRLDILSLMVENPGTRLTLTYPTGGASYYRASWDNSKVSVNDLDAMEPFLRVVYPRNGNEYYTINPDLRKLFFNIWGK